MHRGNTLWLVAGLMIGAAGLLHCGSSDSGSGGAGGGGAGSPAGGPISGDTECYNCASSNCGTELNSCYGAGWQSGT